MQRQGGWVATFVVVGAVLAIALLGGLYLIKSHDDQANKTATTSNNEKKQSEQSGSENTPPVETGTSKTPSKSTTPQKNTSTQKDSKTPLPTTGPTEALAEVIVLSILVFAGTSYVRSRRELTARRSSL